MGFLRRDLWKLEDGSLNPEGSKSRFPNIIMSHKRCLKSVTEYASSFKT